MEKSKVVAPKMSEYEKQIQQNIEDRKKMFKMLKLDEAKQELQQICVNSPISTPQSAVASSSATKAHENNKPKRRYRSQNSHWSFSKLKFFIQG